MSLSSPERGKRPNHLIFVEIKPPRGRRPRGPSPRHRGAQQAGPTAPAHLRLRSNPVGAENVK